ncbi:MAG: DUF1972 domain-containing protein [Verrucomicrobiota bacterium]
MKIAFIGSRGIPRCYSGFETFVEELSVRLAERGHTVTVYNRIPFNTYRKKEFKGVRIVHLPTILLKSTDTLFHSLICSIHALFGRYDMIYYCGVGSSLISILPQLFGSRVIINVDGADWAREKWSGLGRWWLRKSESWAARLGDSVIADHPVISKRYQELYGASTDLIPYGANIVEEDPGRDVLEKWSLSSNGYYIYVSRLTPENGADHVMEEFQCFLNDLTPSASSPPQLVVVGDAPYQDEFLQKLRSIAAKTPEIVMTGYVFGDGYAQLSYHARGFIYPTRIDATRPVVLDQMGFGNPIISRDTEANRWVVGDAGVYFDFQGERNLAATLRVLEEDQTVLRKVQLESRERIRNQFDWEVVTNQYEDLFRKLSE